MADKSVSITSFKRKQGKNMGVKIISRAEIRAIMELWHPYRVRLLMDCCNITTTDIAKRLGCTRENVTQALSGKYYSDKVMAGCYGMLQEAMGDDCPEMCELFSDHPCVARIPQCANM